MDELMWMRLYPGGFGSGIDWAAVFSFFTIAVVYLLIPVLGYPPERRGMIAASLYLLIGYAALSLLQFGMIYLQLLELSSRGGGREPSMLSLFVFTILKMLVFLLAMVLFVVGLQALRLRRGGGRDERNPDELGTDPRIQDRWRNP
jgi:hypothetical protein